MQVCKICHDFLLGKEASRLIALKNRGKYFLPSKDVSEICVMSERLFRQHLGQFTSTNHKTLSLKIFSLCGSKDYFTGQEMLDHIKSQDIFDNHRTQLIKLIIEIFLKIRVHHECKTKTVEKHDFRHKYSRLILFQHQ